MPTPQELVEEFHNTFGIHMGCKEDLKSDALVDFRTTLIDEEFHELLNAVDKEDIVETADALADLVYVIYGTAITFGINLDVVFEEVHRSNMTKERSGDYSDPNKPHKVIKGLNYSPPDIAKILGVDNG